MREIYEITLKYYVTTLVEAENKEEAIRIAQGQDLSGQLEGCGIEVDGVEID